MAMTISSPILLTVALLILWALLLQAVITLTLRDRDRVRRRRAEMAELQLRWEATVALNGEVEALAAAKGIRLTPSPEVRTYREWWEAFPRLNGGPVSLR